MKKTFAILPLVAALAAGGCASPYQAGVYHSGLTAQPVEVGRVLAVQKVKVSPGKQNAGAVLGVLGGAAVGDAVGGHNLLATLGGALAGGWAGSRIEQSAARQPAYQITVRILRGPIIAVVEQGHRVASMKVGACVQVIQGQGSGGYLGGGQAKARVMPLPASSCATSSPGVQHYSRN